MTPARTTLSPIAFGPVPSRRLGQSLGINNIPPKFCSYSCVYCQVGVTRNKQRHRRGFFPPQQIVQAVEARLDALRRAGQAVDYLTFVPDGEPTLDVDLGHTIQLLKPLGLPVAVITNASLLWQPAVRGDLRLADWVSVKIDSTDEPIWHRINRPHSGLGLSQVLQGIVDFAGEFEGTLVSETMLVAGVNDSENAIEQVARFVSSVEPQTAYLSVPTRPPAEPEVAPSGADVVTRAYEQFRRHEINTELLTTELSGEFGFSGELEQDLLGTAAVHPLSQAAIQGLLDKAGQDWALVDKLVEDGQLVAVDYGERRFYVRAAAVATE